MKKINIGDILMTILVILFIVLFLQEIKLNMNVIKQESCVELNSKYYCEVEK